MLTELQPADTEKSTPSLEVRALARELVRSLRQASDYAKRLDTLQGHAMQGEAGPLCLSRSLEIMAQKVCGEFFHQQTISKVAPTHRLALGDKPDEASVTQDPANKEGE